MKQMFRRRPSAAMIVAMAALVMGASGTAVAASKLVSGDKLIKKHSLSGNRIRYKSLTGYEIKLSKLGTVPNAKYANAANDANFATQAGSADSATNASNLGGQPASAYMPASRLIRSGSVTLTAPSTSGQSTSQTLLTAGPFTVTGKCINAGSSGTTAELDGVSSVANSDIGGHDVSSAGTTRQIDAATSTAFLEDQTMWDYDSTLLTPGGQGYTLLGDDIANPGGTAGTCQFDVEALSLS